MKQILVVDDDLSLRTILNETLTTSGYKVQIAKDGKTGLDFLSEKRFDLVISDLMMPGMTGIEFMVAAKKIHENLGFLIITAYGTVETAVEALHKGAFDFVTKPFSISQLESRVNRYFEYQDLKAENKALKRKLSDDRKYTKLIGQSPEMLESSVRLVPLHEAMLQYLFRVKVVQGRNLLHNQFMMGAIVLTNLF